MKLVKLLVEIKSWRGKSVIVIISARGSRDDRVWGQLRACLLPDSLVAGPRFVRLWEQTRMNSVPCSSALAPACAKSHRIRIVNNSFTCIASFLSELQVNTKSITQAFKKYCDMVISQFDPEEEARLIAGFYKEMSARKPFIEWFKGYVQKKDDADFILHALSSHP